MLAADAQMNADGKDLPSSAFICASAAKNLGTVPLKTAATDDRRLQPTHLPYPALMRYLPLLPAIAAWLFITSAAAGEPAIADRGTYLAALTQAMAVDWPKNRSLTIVC